MSAESDKLYSSRIVIHGAILMPSPLGPSFFQPSILQSRTGVV